ncbi:MAG: RNA-protein complex protein Nop10 [Candidatus Aenigmarchaeota archaeon]|nr:RNA-protein complex protein Nop10 [Candidatus Aenigmarchaeota archaeon]
MNMIKKCFHCGIYTLKDRCPKCGGETRTPHPPKFSPEDKYGKYRLIAKQSLKNTKPLLITIKN